MSYSSPKTPTITSPVLLDKRIQSLQIALSALSWLDYSFARARLQTKETEQQGLVSYPEVFQGDGLDWQDVFPNDILKSFCFWYVPGGEVLDYPQDRYHEAVTQLIFQVNLKKIDPGKTYYYLEELKKDVLDILALKLKQQETLTAYFDNVRDVYTEFTTDYIAPRYVSKDFGFMRFDILLKYFNRECAV